MPCTYCEETAIEGTNPPVCEEHRHTELKEANTLKELGAEDVTGNNS